MAAPPVHPLRRALAGDPHLRGDVGDRTVLAALDQAATALDGQRGVTVEHGRIFRSSGRRIGVFHPAAERFVPFSSPPRWRQQPHDPQHLAAGRYKALKTPTFMVELHSRPSTGCLRWPNANVANASRAGGTWNGCACGCHAEPDHPLIGQMKVDTKCAAMQGKSPLHAPLTLPASRLYRRWSAANLTQITLPELMTYGIRA